MHYPAADHRPVRYPHGRTRSDAPPRERGFERMAEELQLTDEQKTQLQQIREEESEKFKTLREESKARFDAVLTAEQRQKMEEMHEQRRERMERTSRTPRASRTACDCE
ncbi:Spy/CpxP family protein refolding chaperone [Halopseudomonas pachastrellae]|nr:Spy/CpxP family protein refolding chaperone [Halopseudomonas pachastrellae]